MAGYTHEDIAEKLDVSARQVRNYLDRATSLVQAYLEDMAHTKNLAFTTNPNKSSAFLPK